MAELLTDDMDIRDTTLDMYVGGNGDYYLQLKETKRGNVVKIDTRIATSGGNATPEILKAIANLYRALQGEPPEREQANELLPPVSNSVCFRCNGTKEVASSDGSAKKCPQCR
nr:hypothetical protein [Bacteroidota bacterium]